MSWFAWFAEELLNRKTKAFFLYWFFLEWFLWSFYFFRKDPELFWTGFARGSYCSIVSFQWSEFLLLRSCWRLFWSSSYPHIHPLWGREDSTTKKFRFIGFWIRSRWERAVLFWKEMICFLAPVYHFFNQIFWSSVQERKIWSYWLLHFETAKYSLAFEDNKISFEFLWSWRWLVYLNDLWAIMCFHSPVDFNSRPCFKLFYQKYFFHFFRLRSSSAFARKIF